MMRVIDRQTFHEVLDEVSAQTTDPRIGAQLEWMAATTADGATPAEDDRLRVDVGPLAARELERNEYSKLLKELDYSFRRYDALLEPLGRERRAILQVLYGRKAFKKHVLELGERRKFGALELWWGGVVGHVRDRYTISELRNGEYIRTDDATLRFFVEAHTARTTPARDVAKVRATLDPIHARGHLWAVIDAARSRRALQLAEESVDAHASLYQGDRGRGLDDAAPYLVRLAADSGLYGRLLEEGWGDAWGIFVASRAKPKMVRRSMRRLLMVETEHERERLYFRFYDPRVLAKFLPLATPRQRSELLAEVDGIYFEDEDATLRNVSHS